MIYCDTIHVLNNNKLVLQIAHNVTCVGWNESLLIILKLILAKSSHAIQLKIENLYFVEKPSPEIRSVGKEEIVCSAYGNVGKMSGEWTTADGTNINTVVNRIGNIFQIKATVKKTDTYICSIKSGKKEIKAAVRVNIFTRKYEKTT